MAQYYFEIYVFGSGIKIDNNAVGTGVDGFVDSNGANNAQNNAWGSMQNGGWSVGPDAGAEFYLTTGAHKVGIWLTDDDGYLQDGAGETGAVQTLLYPVTINGVTYPAGSRVELEYAVDTDAGGDGADYYVIRLGGNGLTETQGDTGTNVGILATTSDSLQTMTLYHVDNSIDGPSLPYAKALCFAGGTLIETPDGERPVEQLRVGDMVLTRDHGAQALLWTGSQRLSLAALVARPDLWPIAFRAGTIGNRRRLLLSPLHRVLLADWRAQLFYGAEEVLVSAKFLVDRAGILPVLPPTGVRYYHLLCARHEVLIAEGAFAESFFPGISACEFLSPLQLDAVTQAIAGSQDASQPMMARPVVSRRQAAALHR